MQVDPEKLRRAVIRERETEARIKAMDAHEIVALVHALEDERDAATARAEAAEREASDARMEMNRIFNRSRDRKNELVKERDAATAERDRMREALERWQHYGCPDCGGDCASANPPIACCIMRKTHEVLTSAKEPSA